MSRLRDHLEHIQREVVPARGAAQGGLDGHYLAEVGARAQPPLLARGLEQWNAGHFYAQHETLEWLWRSTAEPVRDALKGIIQSGVGAYHVLNHNRRGALGKWTGALGYLAPFEAARPYGVDVGALRAQVAAARQALLDDEGPESDWTAHEPRARALRILWEPRLAEPRVSELLRRMDHAWAENPLSVEAALAGLGEGEARWQAAGSPRSIAQALTELGVGKAMAANRCFGDGTLRAGQVIAPAAWRDVVRWLTERHEALREGLGFRQDGQLDERRGGVGGARMVGQIIEATIQNDLHQASEIFALRDSYRKQDGESV